VIEDKLRATGIYRYLSSDDSDEDDSAIIGNEAKRLKADSSDFEGEPMEIDFDSDSSLPNKRGIKRKKGKSTGLLKGKNTGKLKGRRKN
jgi:hypothetical protein